MKIAITKLCRCINMLSVVFLISCGSDKLMGYEKKLQGDIAVTALPSIDSATQNTVLLTTITPQQRLIVNDGNEALDYLIRLVKQDKLYSNNCQIFMLEHEDRYYFDLSVREKHNDVCAGDPKVSPIIDRFRIYRNSDAVLWYDFLGDRYLLYDSTIVKR